MSRGPLARSVLLTALAAVCLPAILRLPMLGAREAAAAASRTGNVAASVPTTNIGETIYRKGIMPSGEPLEAEREPGMHIEGASAACVNCHRRSGLGMKEGRRTIPPIAASYLFHPRARGDDLDLPFVEGMKADRDPYSEATLARAIRAGIAADGQPLSYLMPHFHLDDAQMTELIAYLRKLSPGVVPGVTGSVLHFATIVTPDADPAERQGVIEVLRQFFDDKNRYTRAESPRLQSSRRMMFKVNRHWELHVWELTGAAETWEAQLRAKLHAEPVFAVISGVGGRTWAPVQRFCEAEELPCLFPNVDLPVNRESDFDTLYFSKGVLLEAQLIAHELRGRQHGRARVIQIYRTRDVGEEAAAELGRALRDVGVSTVDRALGSGASERELAAAVASIEPGDAVVLWLRPKDLRALPAPPAHTEVVYLSGRMGGLEHAPLSPQWRKVTHIAYPFNLPDRRRVQMDYPLGWFRMRQITVVAEQAQADTYLACAIVSDVINHMVDTFVRDYLVERIEEALEHRMVTGYYPRLALAPGQRFASKGGYVVHFADGEGQRVIADGGWMVP